MANNKTSKTLNNDLAGYEDYAFSMRGAPRLGESTDIISMLPIIVFAAVTILLVRMTIYSRPMTQFFWTSSTDESVLSDFFSYAKMTCILICAAIALILLLWRIARERFALKHTIIYIPMIVYAFFVVISYAFSDYKEFSLYGWNDRFEGTLPLLAYMLMLFIIINTVNGEANVKQILWPLSITSLMLSILGITQYTNHDFFRTTIGQLLITPGSIRLTDGSTIHEAIRAAAANGERYLNFAFTNQVYQTVYNINYVSFYLTLLIPVFAMLFVRAWNKGSGEPLWKKIALGVLFALNIFNFIGSKSSGGYLGLILILLFLVLVFGRQLKHWWKPILILFLITAVVMGITYDRWLPEVKGTISGAQSDAARAQANAGSDANAYKKPVIDYMETTEEGLTASFNGNPMTVRLSNENGPLQGFVYDADGNELELTGSDEGIVTIEDDRFRDIVQLRLMYDGSETYLQMLLGTTNLRFAIGDNNELLFFNQATGKTVPLRKIDSFGFEDHQRFGSGRGYIWSRTLPLLKDRILIGSGADTYCAVFPQNDYAGKYNANWNIYTITDKPHNMYMGMAVGTGVISMIAAIAMYAIYIVQSILLFRKHEFGTDYLSFAGGGIFLGVAAFALTALVDDSTVSVMPIFYTMLGTGIAINMILKRRKAGAEARS